MALLDEDWRVARSTKAFEERSGEIVFELRYLRSEGGEPLRVHMRRMAAAPSGKRWKLTAIGDGPDDLGEVGLDGLPAKDEGAWTDLLGACHATASPLRTFAQTVSLGSWDELLNDLAHRAAPEDWGEDHAALKEYLAITFCRVMHQGRLAVSANRAAAAFDTGLLTADAERILMRLVAQEGDIPWRFDGFAEGAFGLEPQPVSYLASLLDVTLSDEDPVVIAPRLELLYGASLVSAVWRGVRATARNYRLGTPAYDPQANELRLLVPLGLEGAGPDHALVLAPRAEGGHTATAVLSLERARICARIVSCELPAWLQQQ
jgi:hypothetical protein